MHINTQLIQLNCSHCITFWATFSITIEATKVRKYRHQLLRMCQSRISHTLAFAFFVFLSLLRLPTGRQQSECFRRAHHLVDHQEEGKRYRLLGGPTQMHVGTPQAGAV